MAPTQRRGQRAVEPRHAGGRLELRRRLTAEVAELAGALDHIVDADNRSRAVLLGVVPKEVEAQLGPATHQAEAKRRAVIRLEVDTLSVELGEVGVTGVNHEISARDDTTRVTDDRLAQRAAGALNDIVAEIENTAGASTSRRDRVFNPDLVAVDRNVESWDKPRPNDHADGVCITNFLL